MSAERNKAAECGVLPNAKIKNVIRKKNPYIGENIKMKLILGCNSASSSGKIICVIRTTFVPRRVDLDYKATKGIFCVVIKERCYNRGVECYGQQ